MSLVDDAILIEKYSQEWSGKSELGYKKIPTAGSIR